MNLVIDVWRRKDKYYS